MMLRLVDVAAAALVAAAIGGLVYDRVADLEQIQREQMNLQSEIEQLKVTR